MRNLVRYQYCSRCGNTYPHTAEYFFRSKNKKNGLHTLCKKCSNSKTLRSPDLFDPLNKKCPTCGMIYPRTEEFFGKNKAAYLGLSPYCKRCGYNHKRQQILSNIDATRKSWRMAREKRLKEKNADVREYDRRWKVNQYKTNIEFRLKTVLWSRTRSALNGTAKKESTMSLLGCDPNFLLNHLESLWTGGMSWDNYGNKKGCWTIDHIRPCISFDLTDPQQQKECFHWTNLHPMWATDNASKGSLFNGNRLFKRNNKKVA